MDVVGINSTTADKYSTKTVENGSMGKDDFLQLLVTQMKYQDPTNPMSNQELAAQLAQFSSLETLNNIQSAIEDSTLLQQSLNNSFMTSLIGREVHAYGNSVNYSGSKMDLEYNLAANADTVTVTIKDENGKTVRTIDGGRQKEGDRSVEWDGKDDKGNLVAEGNYTFEVSAATSTGTTVTSLTYVTGTVSGITFQDGSPYLVINGANINLGDVISVLEGSDDDTGGDVTAALSSLARW